MSVDVLAPDDRDEFIRKRVDTILISGRSDSSRMLHLLSSERWMEPVCGTQLKPNTRWLDKPISVYPTDHFPICPQCIEARFDVEVIEVNDHE